MEKYTKCPIDLQQLQLEIVISEESERDVQRQSLQRVAEEVDDRDWRSRAPASDEPAWASGQGQQQQQQQERSQQRGPQQQQQAQNAGGGQGQQQAQAQQQGKQQGQQQWQGGKELPKIQKAEDLGRQKYVVGAAVEGNDRAIRSVKGILNKLTPEKFDRLLAQLLSVITNAAILKATIALVFESAVAQPTFCAMYADLCLHLSREVPEFPPGEGDTRPIKFKRMLLNTCQDEFEGVAEAREELQQISDAQERAAAEKRVKTRTMGTVRLIAELYRQEVVKENIILVCIRELLEAANPKSVPAEDSIEAACEMITISGKALAASEDKKTRDALDGYMARLQRLQDAKELSSRIRFVVRDVVDMRRNKWVPRRETFTAKKLDEVHAEAEAELGMVTVARIADLPALPVQRAGLTQDDFSLLPPLRGGDEGWEFVGKRSGGPRAFAGSSALVGEYRPPEPLARPAPRPAAPAPAAAAPAAAPAAAARPAASGKPLGPDDIESKSKSLFREFASVGDFSEAATCVRELRDAPKAAGVVDLSGVVVTGLSEVFDATAEKQQAALAGLVVRLAAEGVVKGAELLKGLAHYTEGLEDLSLDIPKAPELLGRVVGAAAAKGALALSELPQLLSKCEGAEPKRKLAGAAFRAAAAEGGGDAKLAQLCAAAGIRAGEFLKADEFDGDLPSVEDWLKSEGLSAVPI
ncbi:Eukaryotic initiation factor iso-4F subunit p82-34 [Monoraphidium neglectum]|uniref:Eukaryotic initiation factor iso-4F subunit p82-34 n=1 Tax=Monoraphidium neglectum TaxID=145388 RepID=A0A0D2K2J0_9CHLO|nr:Eukaryotic initiation factor iso-4F subunit p82-34 [Monoraphidium neglectum]KIZ04763.1 Eukaryotic initiation factor iso-4F subunit p82-34 [Monoraphidium neglectum]|eukprot:XP_013903782.1 Eukaryotic initiation factor iso-4F subunit p82-34 [Monoraphidium neglectum]